MYLNKYLHANYKKRQEARDKTSEEIEFEKSKKECTFRPNSGKRSQNDSKSSFRPAKEDNLIIELEIKVGKNKNDVL